MVELTALQEPAAAKARMWSILVGVFLCVGMASAVLMYFASRSQTAFLWDQGETHWIVYPSSFRSVGGLKPTWKRLSVDRLD